MWHHGLHGERAHKSFTHSLYIATNMKILVVSAAIAIASVGAADSSLFDKAVGDVIVESASQCEETIYGVATSNPSTFSTLGK